MTLREIAEAEGTLAMGSPADDDLELHGCSHERMDVIARRCRDCGQHFPRSTRRGSLCDREREAAWLNGYSESEDVPLSPERERETLWQREIGR